MYPIPSNRNGSTEEATIGVNSNKQQTVRVTASSEIASNTCKASVIYEHEGVGTSINSDKGERPNVKKTSECKKERKRKRNSKDSQNKKFQSDLLWFFLSEDFLSLYERSYMDNQVEQLVHQNNMAAGDKEDDLTDFANNLTTFENTGEPMSTELS